MFDIDVITTPHATDCGATCLAMLLSYYGIKVSVADLISEVGVSSVGCTARSMRIVGNMHGLNLNAYGWGGAVVASMDRPSICWWRYRHFVICCGKDENGKVVIIDPDKGRYRLSVDSFAKLFTNVSLFNGIPEEFH